MTIAPGETVGPYRVMEQLGSGGMATVYKGYHPALDRYVAIKVLHPALKKDVQFFERFKREARIVAKLEHPHIIPVYDFNEHQNEPYLVMRFVEGDTLKPRLEGRLLVPQEILDLMRPVCRAVAYAHGQGVLHRDLKPSNIMVSREGNIFVTDFGLARMVQAGESTLSQDMLVGTPQYISPEQAQGLSDLDSRSDIYALGVILFEMLTGRVPFNADTPFATVHDHIYAPLPMPSTLNPGIEPAAERMLLKALAKTPNDRFTTTDDLLQALESTLRAPTATLHPAPDTIAHNQPKRAWPWWAWAGGAALVLCLVAALLLGVWRGRQANRTALELEGVETPLAAPAVDELQAAVPLHQSQTDDPPDQPTNDRVASLEQALADDPDNPQLQIRLGEAYVLTGQSEAALALFKRAAAAEPTSAIPLAGQALALLDLDQDDAAKQAIDQALAADPASSPAQLANAVYLARQGHPREALRQMRELFQDRDSSPLERERAQKLFKLLTE